MTFLNLYKNLCPHLFNGYDNTSTCCDFNQLKRFSSQMAVPKQLLSRCPSCYLNFRSFLCDLTCSPIQSEFFMITQDQYYKNPSNEDGQMEVVQVTYHLTNNYANNLFDSCKCVKA